MSWDETKLFLSKVVAWPNDGFGYVNLHYSLNAADGRKIVTGKPYNDIGSFISFAQWAENHADFKDIWFCLSLQKMAGVNSNGKPKALRLSVNSRFLKAIWIDIDVGNTPDKPDKHYDTIEEAWTALDDFIGQAGLPPLSACVKSGGGLHAYWISDTNLTPEEWRPYAEGLRTLLVKHGLKCDAGLTTDNVRLLRVPETSNHKYNPPRKVELMQLPLVEYNFPTQLAFLTTLAPLAIQASSSGATNPYFDPAIFPKQLATGPVESLAEGIDKYEATPLDPTEVVKGCKFIFNALKTGGRDYDNPMWNLTTLCATFMENGQALAHKMSKGHPDYQRATTQALFDRKMAERLERNFGWPACATIEANGCKDCATCPFKPKGKSPLNLAKPKVTATVINGAQFDPATIKTPGITGDWLPDGYVLDQDKCICWLEPQKDIKGVPAPPIPRLLFRNTLDLPWAQKDPDVLHMFASYDKGNFLMVSIRVEDMVGPGSLTKIVQAKLKPVIKMHQQIQEFLMTLLAKLHKEKEAQISFPFGWHVDKQGQRAGFVYGGVLNEADGSVLPAGCSDNNLAMHYLPHGELAKWKVACDYITSLGRPEHDALIAMSFASPLVHMSGETGMILAAYGESGTGKTAAMLVGLSVWGKPAATKENKSTTHNSLMNKLAQKRHLPTYWDEITDEKTQSHAIETAFDISSGTEKGRMEVVNGIVRQRAVGTWQCALAMSANVSLVDYAMLKHPGHAGSINRILEYEVGPNDPKKLGNATEAARAFKDLDNNYGMVGMMYAKFIAMHHAALDIEVRDTCIQVGNEVGAIQQDRLWVALIGCLIVGAKYANQMGASINLPALKIFLYETFKTNRDKRDGSHVVGGSLENTENILTEYLKERLSTGAIWTSSMHFGKGRAAQATVIQGPELGKGPCVIQVRFDLATRTMAFSERDFTKWVVLNKRGGTSQLLNALKKHYGATGTRRSLAAGTRYGVTQEPLVIISIGAGSPFEQMLLMNGGGEAGAIPPPDGGGPAPADTGIETAAEIKAREETGRQVVAAVVARSA